MDSSVATLIVDVTKSALFVRSLAIVYKYLVLPIAKIQGILKFCTFSTLIFIKMYLSFPKPSMQASRAILAQSILHSS
ncbi:uncharacterized protein LY89DRAFT_42587 [Mollisia scopiformis]|uniref:Uncharacterized protein n=1 Tax=Mollisia scopiformis TaxID=149040 RepID=A0A194XDJ5_MOLSC|nr:uncharacterized protein LY89DRAFT_42587 [Mollisia scopiformis]KUJ18221.1 hypothetical protein LY89DRAFT_42587 [Mollisia scopiformis]